MILDRLKDLWALPALLHNETHLLQSSLDRLTESVRMALSRQPPAFVLVFLQGVSPSGAPFVAAMSGELNGGQLRLRHDITSPVASFTILVFCDVRRVRIASMSAGNFQLTSATRSNDTAAPMAHHPHELRTGNAVIVELETR